MQKSSINKKATRYLTVTICGESCPCPHSVVVTLFWIGNVYRTCYASFICTNIQLLLIIVRILRTPIYHFNQTRRSLCFEITICFRLLQLNPQPRDLCDDEQVVLSLNMKMVTILFFLLLSSFASIIGRDFKSAFISILKRLFCYCWSVSLKWLVVLLHSLLSTISIKLLEG